MRTDITVTDDKPVSPELTPSVPPPADVTKVRPSWIWIRDASGYGSVTVTILFISFWVTTIAFVLSIFEKIGPVSIRPFDVGACSAYFIPVLTLYFGRKFTDAKMGVNQAPPADPKK